MLHDPGYELLFSHARMVEDLLRGFVPEDWGQGLDFTSLEKVSASTVSDDLRERDNDVIWRVRWNGPHGEGHWLYVYLMLEFQSRVDPGWPCGCWPMSRCSTKTSSARAGADRRAAAPGDADCALQR